MHALGTIKNIPVDLNPALWAEGSDSSLYCHVSIGDRAAKLDPAVVKEVKGVVEKHLKRQRLVVTPSVRTERSPNDFHADAPIDYTLAVQILAPDEGRVDTWDSLDDASPRYRQKIEKAIAGARAELEKGVPDKN